MTIHLSAQIDSRAEIAQDVSIGAYSIIGPNVKIGAGTVIGPHVVIKGPCKIGKANKIFQFSSIGEQPQDLKFQGEKSLLEIGDNNTIREFTTLNRGTQNGGGITKIGNDNLFMAYVHVAHDCIIGNYNILANNTSLAGHVIIDDFVTLGGFTLISQFIHIGSYAFSAMASVINKHVPPYMLVSGHMARPVSINTIGLTRRGFSKQEVKDLRNSFKFLYKTDLKISEALEQISKLESAKADTLIDFIQSLEDSNIGLTR